MIYRLVFVALTPGMETFEKVIDLLFAIDMLINCFLAYKDENGKLVTKRCKIFCRYF